MSGDEREALDRQAEARRQEASFKLLGGPVTSSDRASPTLAELAAAVEAVPRPVDVGAEARTARDDLQRFLDGELR